MTDKDQKELFSCLLDMLDTFDSICKTYNLTYLLSGGTLLGAVRHKGFIPWDDDLDIAMPRKDYNKLLEIGEEAFQAPYFFQTPSTDPGYYKTFVKIRKSDTTFIPVSDAAYDMNHGVFLDIFPMDSIPDNTNDFKRQVQTLKSLALLLRSVGRVGGKVGSRGLSTPKKVIYYLLLPMEKMGLITSAKIFKRINKIASKYENIDTSKIGYILFSFDDSRNLWQREDFSNLVPLSFEGRSVLGPCGYDRVLSVTYGDYMTPVKQRSEHGTSLYDVHTSYVDYVRDHRYELDELWKSSR